MSKYLVTSALPYSNGNLHIGHIAGAYLPADIFVRFLRLKSEDVHFVCGTDEHGAPISIKADAAGVPPKAIVEKYHKSISEDFKNLQIIFDNFSGTARPIHHKTSKEFFLNLYQGGFILTKQTEQFYCEHDRRFLADRYVEGICPFCGNDGARGDQCDNCGKLMETLSLGEPKCKICGNTPFIRKTKHWFLDMPKFEKRLRDWIQSKTYWKENIRKFILGLLDEGLIPRAITRDINWGIPVPLDGALGKVLYVWFDAPIGYLSSSMEYFAMQKNPDGWRDYWLDDTTKLIHFIGKDNNIFHALFWPAVLMGQKQNFILPHDIPANEFLNLEGEKLSTSKNWAIWVGDFLKDFDGDLLRYYIARIAPENKDSDFAWADFGDKVNSDLANNLGNLANRVFTFSKKFFDGAITKPKELSESSQKLLKNAIKNCKEIEKNYQSYKVRANTLKIMELAKSGNRYFDECAPWKSVKTDKTKAEETLFVCCELLRIVSIVFYPIIPKSMQKLRAMMSLKDGFLWDDIANTPDIFNLGDVRPLFPRIDKKVIAAQIEKLKNNAKLKEESIQDKEQISIADFEKLQMKVVKILKCEKVKKSKKLVRCQINTGCEKRVVFAGLAQHYNPQELVGKKVVMLTNLKPKKLFGQESQGMILAAVDGEKLSLLAPIGEVPMGSEVS